MTMRTLTLSLILLACAWSGLAANASDYPTHRRDSILRLITGARTQAADTVYVSRLGADATGRKDARQAFVKAMRLARKRGKLHVVVPRGDYLVKGPIHLESGVCLELQEGATLRFSPDANDYLPLVETSWEGSYLRNYSPMIYGRGLHDVAIIGKGTIDGNCAETFGTWRDKQKEGRRRSRQMNHEGIPPAERVFGDGYFLRPQLIQLYECEGVTIEDVFITNSPFWCIHLLRSENVICRGIRYDAKLVNNDGIDPESSRNVLIENIHFNNGDDNVAIKSGRDNDGWTFGKPSAGIIIRGCHFKGLHGVVIGSEMSAGVENVFIEDCDYAGYCKRGIYVKTNPDRGGYIRGVFVSNVRFDEVEDLFYVTSMYAGEGADSRHFTDIEDLYVENLACRKATNFGIALQGTKAKPIRKVRLQGIRVDEVKNAISLDNTEDIIIRDCHLGKRAGTPSFL